MSGGGRVSIPGSVRRTIQNIKEIAGNHSDEEVYAMLKECAMDPNDTAQRLLLQDTFHEVKRKRDKRKENNNRESADSKWRPGVQGRGGRIGRGNFSSRSVANDASGGRNANSGKDNGVNQDVEKGTTSTCSPKGQDADMKSASSMQSAVGGLVNGPAKLENPVSSQEHAPLGSSAAGVQSKEGTAPMVNDNIRTTLLAPLDVKSGSAHAQSVPDSNQFQLAVKSASISGVYASASDPVLVPSIDTYTVGAVGTIKREIGGQKIESTTNKVGSHSTAGFESSTVTAKGFVEMKSSYLHGKLQGKSQGSEANHLPDAPQDASSTSLTSSTGSRPSSNYSSRPQQLSSQKVGPGKGWKPKSTHANAIQAAETLGSSDAISSTVETVDQMLFVPSSEPSEDTATKLQRKLEELNFSDTRHVIIPNHLQVPESERTGLSFGSFDASFGLGMSSTNGLENEKNSTPLSESSQDDEENAEEPPSSSHVASSAAEEVAYPDNSTSHLQMPEDLSSREENLSSSVPAVSEYDKSKAGAAFTQEGPQYSVVHTSPTYSTFGLVPQMLGNQFQSFDSNENQSRESARLSGFVVQQPFDPSTSYYTQFYRPADGDGRLSPFLAPGAPTKYNGAIAAMPAQTSQSPQEIGNGLTLSSGGPSATQAAGVMQSSIAVTQQPLPVFRQPGGVPISHYPPNLIPYNQYIPPFYVAPPTIHHFLSNTAFPQQPPTGSIYPPPAAASSATPVKYSVPQQKPGSNTSNSTHVGMPTGYGAYSTTPAGYNTNPSVTSGNSTSNEDLAASQYKENNVYATGQQTEGSGLWFPAPGRDIAGLPAGSFYNFPAQGQHLSFAPTQPGHGAFAGIYHPNQTVAAAGIHPLLQQSQAVAGAVEMVGPSAGIYQQPQRAQINWANN